MVREDPRWRREELESGPARRCASDRGLRSGAEHAHPRCEAGRGPEQYQRDPPFGPEEYDADSNMGPFVSHNEWGTDHFSFRVHEDLDAFCDKIRARGASFSVEPYPFMPGSRIAYLQAPDNVSIELVQGPLTPSL